MFPSGPTVRSCAGLGIAYSVIVPLWVMRPSLATADSMNQSAPSGPTMMRVGMLEAVGIVLKAPLLVRIAFGPWSVAHGPSAKATPTGSVAGPSVTVPPDAFEIGLHEAMSPPAFSA